MMKLNGPFWSLLLLILLGCSTENSGVNPSGNKALAEDVRKETLRTWSAYREYAWGHDELKPLSKGHKDLYEGNPLCLTMIEAYSTLMIMGFKEEAREIEYFIADSMRFDLDITVPALEINARVLGGLLTMFEMSLNPLLLDKAEDLGRRLLPVFETPTGLPNLYVNLKTGATSGENINLAAAGTYTPEMGVLSYYTQDPAFYQRAKKAVLHIYNNRSDLGLIPLHINTQSGKWENNASATDSTGINEQVFYESLFKSWKLFGDTDMLHAFKSSLSPIHQYTANNSSERHWQGQVNAQTGERLSNYAAIESANWSGLMAYRGDLEKAIASQQSWDWLWNKNGLLPQLYDFEKDQIIESGNQLNPEIIESAFYLFEATGDIEYRNKGEKYWADIKKYGRTDLAFASISDVVSKKQEDELTSVFIGETLKYFYLLFRPSPINLNTCVFSSAGQPFNKRSYKEASLLSGLGI